MSDGRDRDMSLNPLASLRREVWRFAADDGGSTAIEYAIVGVMVAIASIVALMGLSDEVRNTLFGAVLAAYPDI